MFRRQGSQETVSLVLCGLPAQPPVSHNLSISHLAFGGLLICIQLISTCCFMLAPVLLCDFAIVVNVNRFVNTGNNSILKF